jgi:hypothetical protein
MMPLPELLSPKESDWSKSAKSLYIFNRNSVCLFTHKFTSDNKTKNVDLPSEDLVTGGLSGILSLVTEITNEKKNLRVIDKESTKIYFSYGKYVITALISEKYLPVLFKKLDLFTKAFEDEFEQDLEDFKGETRKFEEKGNLLILKYF